MSKKFDLVNRAISDGRNRVQRFCLWEKQFKNYNLPFELHWRSVRASKSNQNKLPSCQGVYAFVVRPNIANLTWCGYILYIGKTDKQTFRQRFGQYFSEVDRDKGRYWVGEMFSRWEENLYYFFAETDSTTADAAEQELLKALLPPNNERFPGTLGKAKKKFTDKYLHEN